MLNVERLQLTELVGGLVVKDRSDEPVSIGPAPDFESQRPAWRRRVGLSWKVPSCPEQGREVCQVGIMAHEHRVWVGARTPCRASTITRVSFRFGAGGSDASGGGACACEPHEDGMPDNAAMTASRPVVRSFMDLFQSLMLTPASSVTP